MVRSRANAIRKSEWLTVTVPVPTTEPSALDGGGRGIPEAPRGRSLRVDAFDASDDQIGAVVILGRPKTKRGERKIALDPETVRVLREGDYFGPQ
ncbi:MAG: hypothetical protein ABI658_20660 [Acidimicrobiales bacterium]